MRAQPAHHPHSTSPTHKRARPAHPTRVPHLAQRLIHKLIEVWCAQHHPVLVPPQLLAQLPKQGLGGGVHLRAGAARTT